jgi:hypothetical protein
MAEIPNDTVVKGLKLSNYLRTPHPPQAPANLEPFIGLDARYLNSSLNNNNLL